MIRSAYLAGRVSHSGSPNEWRELVSAELSFSGILCFLPSLPYRGVTDNDHHFTVISQIDRAAILACDIIIINLEDFGLGAAREVEYGVIHGKKVYGIKFDPDDRGAFMVDIDIAHSLDELYRKIRRDK